MRDGQFYYVFSGDWFVSTVERRNLDSDTFERLRRAGRKELATPGFADRLALHVAETNGGHVHYFDIGANYGQTAVRIAWQFDARALSCTIHCFEPGQAARLAVVNLSVNGVGNAAVYPVAIGSTEDVVPLFYRAGHTEDNKIINKADVHSVRPTITRSLDTIVPTLAGDAPVFLKIDTQGAEVEVFRGLEQLESKRAICGVFEFAAKAISSRMKPSLFLEQRLPRYRLFELDPYQNLVRELDSPRAIAELTSEVWDRPLPFCDVLFVAHEHGALDWVRSHL